MLLGHETELWHKSPDSNIWNKSFFSDLEFRKSVASFKKFTVKLNWLKTISKYNLYDILHPEIIDCANVEQIIKELRMVFSGDNKSMVINGL